MQHRANPRLRGIQHFFQTTTIALIAGLAVAITGFTIASATGLVPWLTVPMTLGDVALPNAGLYIQITLCALLIGLAFTIPSALRIMQLERTHRDFNISMEDISAAYRASHAADRAGVFNMSREFDSVRARIKHLREHPNLGSLEAGILETAAQMSYESRDLASVYSDDKVERARTFLEQRQQESAEMLENIKHAKDIVDELTEWEANVDADEATVATQMDRLEKQLATILPALKPTTKTDDTVIRIGNKRANKDPVPTRM
jgi:hypothetical protein